MRRKMRVICAMVILISVIGAITVYSILCAKPAGGAFYSGDFQDGFDIYVIEGYLEESSKESGRQSWRSPHALWEVSDTEIKRQLYELGEEIESVRALRPAHDFLFGFYPGERGPIIFIDTGDYWYRLQTDFGEQTFAEYIAQGNGGYPEIYDEIAPGTPLFQFYRMERREETVIYDAGVWVDFLSDPEDSVTSDFENGWYSTMPQDSYEELLALIESLDDTNSKLLQTIE